jgi:transposase
VCACRSSLDNWWVGEGIVWVARTGSFWCDLPERFGTWNTGLTQVLPLARCRHV